MTGFATVQAKYDETEVTCEIRSVNSRYLEISVKLPRVLADLENQIKEFVRGKISRGKVMYSLNFSSLTSELQNLKIDPSTVRTYMNLLEQMQSAAGLDAPIKLDHLLFFKDIISFEEESKIDESLTDFIRELTEQALDKLNEMRSLEGENLRSDLENRLEKIAQLAGEVAELGKDSPRVEFDKMYQRLMTMLGNNEIDRTRLEQELAIISDKVDITEETVRMKSHIQLFRDNLQAGSPLGKKLNFILQEMHREANTMSNKTTIIEISHRVVSMKEDIEKLREQVQNIE